MGCKMVQKILKICLLFPSFITMVLKKNSSKKIQILKRQCLFIPFIIDFKLKFILVGQNCVGPIVVPLKPIPMQPLSLEL